MESERAHGVHGVKWLKGHSVIVSKKLTKVIVIDSSN